MRVVLMSSGRISLRMFVCERMPGFGFGDEWWLFGGRFRPRHEWLLRGCVPVRPYEVVRIDVIRYVVYFV